jgi:hypothetical protein
LSPQQLPIGSGADGSANGRVNANDFIVWADQFEKREDDELDVAPALDAKAMDAALLQADAGASGRRLDWWLAVADDVDSDLLERRGVRRGRWN